MTAVADLCARCEHPADWHRLDSDLNIGPTHPDAVFRCIGYDCTLDYSTPTPCDDTCPDFIEVAR